MRILVLRAAAIAAREITRDIGGSLGTRETGEALGDKTKGKTP